MGWQEDFEEFAKNAFTLGIYGAVKFAEQQAALQQAARRR